MIGGEVPLRMLVLTPAMLVLAEQYLTQVCPVMARLIAKYAPCTLAKIQQPPLFPALVTAILSQQLSAKAAETLNQRVQWLVPDLPPSEFLNLSSEELRSAGLSHNKALCLQELAERITKGYLDLEAMSDTPDEGVIATLTTVPGIGRWTAEMFLLFGLKRLDILALGDAGLQRTARRLFGETAKLDSIGQVWKPYRSVASWYLWQDLDRR